MGPYNPSKYIVFEEDFVVGSGIGKLTTVSSGTGAQCVATNTGVAENHHGLIIFATGTTTTGRGASSTGSLRLGGRTSLTTMINITQLSTVSEEFILDVGFGNTFNSSSAFTDGIFFRYDRLTSANWIRGTGATLTASTTAVATGDLRLRFEVNAALSSVEFFVNDVSIGSNTTNIPATTTTLQLGGRIVKSAGTTSVSFVMDYLGYRMKLTTAR